MNAFAAVFPGKAQSVCFFHLCQAVWKKTRETGLQTAYAEDADLALKIRCLPALALLHPDDVPDGYEAVAAELPDAAAELAAYFERQYIGANVISDRLQALAERRRNGEVAMADYLRAVAHNFTL
ncbi:hypothetical protein FJT64_012972 [Amphibalanus amphitrite]|uniref:MULE transposase domain-containing protein n=1 Tax=Amphibalanus amphitrite TaxID=1232801 RepID=A0A6A4V1T8_AMPAM|nr:hypothetical protein FJT64_012972 [Amphibalanus amphitrite]